MISWVRAAGMLLAVAAVAVAWRAGAQGGPSVPDFPTPQPVVEQMLTLAGVTKDDTVFDLGCGDGRIVVTAAKKFGARGVGVDIAPLAVERSLANMRGAGVADRVTVLKQDMFATDISKATVVALYLSPAMNLRLRPKLLRELRPGSRVVSHVYDMGDWRPDRSQPAGDSKKYHIYLWTVPAAIGGAWRWSMTTAAGLQSDLVTFDQRYQRATGSLDIGGMRLSIGDAALDGPRLTFVAAGGPVTARFSGIVSGRTMRGTLQVEGGTLAGSHPWSAERE